MRKSMSWRASRSAVKCLLTESTATGELWGEKMPIVLRIQKGQPALLGISSTKITFTKWQQLFFFFFGGKEHILSWSDPC